MTNITSTTTAPGRSSGWQDTADSDAAFEPLSAEQARQWRARCPQVPVARVLALQAMAGAAVALLAWALSGRAAVGCSAAYGALVAVLPAALAAKGTARWAAPGFTPGAALAGFVLWEVVKLVLAVGMLMAAPKILVVPSWPALLIGLALTLMMYGVSLCLAQSIKSRQGQVQKG